jgi:hypothetical protein
MQPTARLQRRAYIRRNTMKAGQVWEDASGVLVRLSDRKGYDDSVEYPFFGSATEDRVENARHYRVDGTRYLENMFGSSRLLKLVEDGAELDTSKPMRRKINDGPVEFLTVDNAGFIYVQEPSTKYVFKLHPEFLENIPEPKRTYEVTVGLVPFTTGPSIRTDFDDFSFVHSRASVTYTEGEGWSVEEVKP